MFRFSACVPVWASAVQVHVNVFVPYPASSQQLGVVVPCSRDVFWSRLVVWLLTKIVIGVVVVALPARSTARTASVCEPLPTDREFQLNVYGPEVSVAATEPSTR